MTHPTRAFSGSIINRFTGSKILARVGQISVAFPDLIQCVHSYGFKWAEAMPQMETNTAVQSEWQYFDAEQHRRHRCYRKEIG